MPANGRWDLTWLLKVKSVILSLSLINTIPWYEQSLKIVFSLPLVPVLKLSFVVSLKWWTLVESAEVTVVTSGRLQPYRIFECTHDTWLDEPQISSWYSGENKNSKTRKPRLFMFLLTEDMIYLLTAIGLPPGGCSTVHIYTQTIHKRHKTNNT
jgi:hypothetical protein